MPCPPSPQDLCPECPQGPHPTITLCLMPLLQEAFPDPSLQLNVFFPLEPRALYLCCSPHLCLAPSLVLNPFMSLSCTLSWSVKSMGTAAGLPAPLHCRALHEGRRKGGRQGGRELPEHLCTQGNELVPMGQRQIRQVLHLLPAASGRAQPHSKAQRKPR